VIDASRKLVGRRSELALLEGALDGLESGRTPVFQVVGEPGIGKSRLMAEVAARADERQYHVFAGRAAEFEGEVPFGVFVDALDSYLGSVNPALLRGLGDDQMGELAAVFPALAELAEASPAALQNERYRAHHAVRAMLEVLAKRRPCLLVLDDMHWADQASLELLAHLLRRRPDAAALILVAFRPPQAPERLRAPLERAEREGACERVDLSPLAEPEATELLDPSLDQGLRTALYRQSGGNPFYLEQLSRAAGRGFVPGGEKGPRRGVPRAVADSIQDEVGGLSERQRRALEGAAVAGDPFPPDLAAAGAELPEAVVLEALDVLVAADLVRGGASPVEFRFRHPIVRAAVYESTPTAWRIGAHRRVAAHLREHGAPTVAVAPHIERSGRPGDADAVALLVEAAGIAAARAPATAARWLESALRLLPEADDGSRVQILVPLARALGSSGQLEASRDTLAEVLDLLPAELGAVRGQVVAFMALVQRLLGSHGDARATLEAALADLPQQRSTEAARLQVEIAADRYLLGEWATAHEWAERALALARETDAPQLCAAAASLAALCCHQQGLVSEANEHVDEAGGIVDRLGDDELAPQIDAPFSLGAAELMVERYDDSVRHLERCIAISRHAGQGHMLAPATVDLSIAHIFQGRLDDASRRADEALEIAYLSGSDQLMEWAQTVRCWVSVKQGDLPEAISAGEEAVRIGRGVTAGAYTIGASCWLADALVEAGDPEAGRRVLLDAIEASDLSNIDAGYHAAVFEVLTRAELARGDLEAANGWADRAGAAVAGLELARPRSLALRAQAAAALAQEQPRRAAELALEGAERWGSGHRVEALQARALAGRALIALGERDRAVTQLERARDGLEECGARRYRDQAVRELRRIGVKAGRGGRRGRADSGVEALSGREREVAELVTERLTNREIAQRLVLSEKTIERHMSRIFVKLGVSSRVEVAREMEAVAPPTATPSPR
jgi:tetratricopeptide (TPR) repeat protein